MTISEVSKITNLTADTLRYYEKIELIKNVNRTAGGKREYSQINLEHINFVNCMKKVGCSLGVIKEYMKLYESGDETIDARVSLLEKQKKLLLEKIVEIQNSVDYLDYKIEHTQKLRK